MRVSAQIFIHPEAGKAHDMELCQTGKITTVANMLMYQLSAFSKIGQPGTTKLEGSTNDRSCLGLALFLFGPGQHFSGQGMNGNAPATPQKPTPQDQDEYEQQC